MHLIRRSSVALTAIAVVLAAAVGPAAAAPAAAGPPAAGTGRLIPLESLGGGESWAETMNERGDMIGGSLDADDNWRAVVWWHDRRTPTALGIDDAYAAAISDTGIITGHVDREGGGGLFRWRQGTVDHLRAAPGTALEAVAVNNRGQVAGTAHAEDGTTRAFLWQGRRMTLLPVPAGTSSSAVGINDRGQIVGVVVRPEATGRAVLWQRGRMTELGTLGGDGSTPVGIDDRGRVAGNSTVAGSSEEHPFLWQRGRMTDLLAGTTATGGRVFALNDTGMATGSVSRSDGHSHPVLWRSGRMIDVGVPGQVGIGTAVNDRGDVAGPAWTPPTADSAVPFRWRNGRTTMFPEPVGDIAVRIVGIARDGTIGVAQETTRSGRVLLRST